MRGLIVCLALVSPGLALGDKPAESQGFIEVPGGPVWYSIAGTGDGIPLLTLHGGPGGTSCTNALLQALGDERPVIRYDQLGTGRSGRPDDMSLWTVKRFVEGVHAVRQELGLEQMHLFGQSWGGALAGAYVLAKGTEGVVSVTFSSPLISTPLWVRDANYLRTLLPEDVQATMKVHEDAGTTDSEEYVEAESVFMDAYVYRGGASSEYVPCPEAPWNPVIYNYMWGPTEFYPTGTLLDFDISDRLHEIDVPVLFITGEFDEARPETIKTFHESVPGSKFVVVEGVGHASYRAKPELFRQELEQFLDWAEAQKKE